MSVSFDYDCDYREYQAKMDDQEIENILDLQ